MPADAEPLVEHFFRHEYGRLVATLTRRFGAPRLDDIEEAVQSALARALSTWKRDGLPDNPSAWLTRVAHNELVDQLRRQRTAAELAHKLEESPSSQPEPVSFSAEVEDDLLRMLFVCCDHQLTDKTQLVLALRLLCGFSTKEIATRLFLSDPNVQKLLSRGKRRLGELWQTNPAHDFSSLAGDQLSKRLAGVQHVVYLVFNQGYSAHDEEESARRELCNEGLRLAQLLTSHPVTQQPSSWALLALLHLHVARFDARRGASGELLMLDQQDRSNWDRRHIQLGMHCLMRSGDGDNFGRYHAEAAVLAEHCMAKTYESTRWHEIVEIYELVEQAHPSPLYTLNRAIALAEWQGPEAGLALLRQHAPPSWLTGYYLWDGTIGELLRRSGDFDGAIRYLERALASTPTHAERQVFERRLAQARAHSSARS